MSKNNPKNQEEADYWQGHPEEERAEGERQFDEHIKAVALAEEKKKEEIKEFRRGYQNPKSAGIKGDKG